MNVLSNPDNVTQDNNNKRTGLLVESGENEEVGAVMA